VVCSSLSVQFFPSFTCYQVDPLGSSFFLVFEFFLFHLAHFSLNSQGRLHAGWLCLIFLLEKKGLCCSIGYSRFWEKVYAFSSSKFHHFSSPLIFSHFTLKEGGNATIQFSFLLGKRGAVLAACSWTLGRGRVTFSLSQNIYFCWVLPCRYRFRN